MGGNVFSEQTQNIPLRRIKPTLEKYCEELKRLFPKKKTAFDSFRPLGSVGKKSASGDIDIGIDKGNFFKGGVVALGGLQDWNVDPTNWENTFKKYKRRARTRTDEQIKWRAFLTEIAKYINNNSNIITFNLKKIGPGTMFSLFPQYTENGEQLDIGVQIDWMVGDISWLEFAYWSDAPSTKEPFLKGLHRTQLMLSMFLIKEYTFTHDLGVKSKNSNLTLTTPDAALVLLSSLFGSKLTHGDVLNFNTLYGWLNRHSSVSEFDSVIEAYLVILDRTKSTKINGQHGGYIPAELEETWIEKKNKLNLSGKYIHKDMNLKIWNHLHEINT